MPSFAGNQQQDAHELTRFLLERLRLEFVRGSQLIAAQAAKESGRILPRGNEHGIGSNLMGNLGIPVPIRRTRTSRSRRQLLGKSWSSSDVDCSYYPAQHCVTETIGEAEGLARLGSPTVGNKRRSTLSCKEKVAIEKAESDGHVIISRWGAVRHKKGCFCRPCLSRRRKQRKDDNLTSSCRTFEQSSEGLPDDRGEKRDDTVFPHAIHHDSKPGSAELKPKTRADHSISEASRRGLECLSVMNREFGLPLDPVWRLFGGTVLNLIHCLRCGHTNTSEEPFLDISLTIPSVVDAHTRVCFSKENSRPSPEAGETVEPGEGPGGCATLQQCLAVHTRDEILSGSAMYSCDHCGSVASTVKKTKLQSLPPVLCLHLKRFTWRGSEHESKLNAHVDFPLENLDLAPYMESGSYVNEDSCSPSIRAVTRARQGENATVYSTDLLRKAENKTCGTAKNFQRGSPGGQERGSTTARQQGIQKIAPASHASADAKITLRSDPLFSKRPVHAQKSTSLLYDLSGVVVHHGLGAANGHYTVFAREESCKMRRTARHSSGDVSHEISDVASPEVWLQFNDEKVVQVTREEVKRCDGYIFFYTKQSDEKFTN